MPIYEYTCKDCGKQFDVLRPMRDADKPIECRICSSEHTQRAISVFFAQSDGRSVAGQAGGCAGCSGGACGSCGHH